MTLLVGWACGGKSGHEPPDGRATPASAGQGQSSPSSSSGGQAGGSVSSAGATALPAGAPASAAGAGVAGSSAEVAGSSAAGASPSAGGPNGGSSAGGGADSGRGGQAPAAAGMSASAGGDANSDMAKTTSQPCPTSIGAWCEELSAGAALNTADIAVDGRGDVIVVGRDRSSGLEDVLVVKYRSDGQFVWARHFGTGPDDTDYASGVAIDQNDDIVVTGSVNPTTSESSYPFVAKLSPDGELRWLEQQPDGFGSAPAVAIDPHGDVITGDIDGNTYKHSSGGELLWAQPPMVAQQALAIAPDASANLFIAGQADTAFLSELSPGGSVVWRTAFGSESGFPVGLALAENGDLLLSGFDAGKPFLARYSAAGKVVWSQSLDGDFSNTAALALDASGAILLLGRGSRLTGDENLITLRSYTQDGVLLGSQAWTPPVNPIFLDFAVSPAGDVFVAGAGSNSIFLFRTTEP